jgi:hypothetical protein
MTSAPLETLRDIHLPLSAMWLTAIFVPLLVGLAWGVRRFVCRIPFRSALRELDAMAATHARDGDATQLVAGVSQLLRRYAQQRFPLEPVAGLSGADWLEFLDAHGGGAAFRSGTGAVLAWRPYARAGMLDDAALVALVRCWLKVNAP